MRHIDPSNAYAISTGPKKDNSDTFCSPWNNGGMKQVIEVANSKPVFWLQHDYPKIYILSKLKSIFCLYHYINSCDGPCTKC